MSMQTFQTFGSLVRNLREKIGQSQDQFASGFGFKKSFLSQLEAGKRLPKDLSRFVTELSRKSGCSSDILYASVGRIPPDVQEFLLSLPYESEELFLEIRKRINYRTTTQQFSKNQIERLANKYLQVFSSISGNFNFPVNVSELSRSVFGVRVEETDFQKLFPRFKEEGVVALLLEGRSSSTKGKPIILLNALDSCENPEAIEPTKSFSIAHELGHYVLHVSHVRTTQSDDRNILFCRTKGLSARTTTLNESQANQFASYLLMPANDLIAVIRPILKKSRYLDLEENKNVLCERYGVSQQVLEYRLQAINIACINTKYTRDKRQLSLGMHAS